MQMAMRYPIPGILSTCTDFILDPSNMVMSVDLFNKARVFINCSTTLKAVFNLAAPSPTTLRKVFPTRIISTDSYRPRQPNWDSLHSFFHWDNYTSHILVLNIRTQPTRWLEKVYGYLYYFVQLGNSTEFILTGQL